MIMKKFFLPLLMIFLVLFIFPTCSREDGIRGDGNELSTETKDIQELRLAEQYGLAYAPLQLLRRTGWLEEELPGVDIQWLRLVNGAAIREAMVSRRLDVGFMGIPPFLIGFDGGMEWRIFSGLSQAPVGLVTWRDDLASLADFDSRDRIALPQPGSIQHILLAMAAEKQLDDPRRFDNQMVTLSHPDGMSALMSRQEVTAHFTSPPYIMMELSEPGMRLILEGKEAVGSDFTFIIGVVMDDFLTNNPETAAGLERALERAFRYLTEKPEEAAGLLSQDYEISPEQLLEYLTWPGVYYEGTVQGLERFITFMGDQGYLKNPGSPAEYFVHGKEIR
jgi:NitT/TauT family transport system substrate-binding protein